jgi:hypothetical protein
MSIFTQTISAAANSCRWNRNAGGGDFLNDRLFAGKGANTYSYDSIFHFTSVSIPKGATIISATLSINVQTYTGSPILIVKGEAADNPATAADAADGFGRSKTTASVNPGFSGTGNKDINVKTIIEEIIARAGWVLNNSLNLFVLDNGTVADGDVISSAAVGTYARTLTIIFTVNGVVHIMIF